MLFQYEEENVAIAPIPIERVGYMSSVYADNMADTLTYSCGRMKEGQGGKGDRCCFAFSGGNTYDSSSCSNRVLYLKIRNKL